MTPISKSPLAGTMDASRAATSVGQAPWMVLAFDDVSDSAAWRETVFDTAAFLASTTVRPPLSRIHGWCYELNLDDCLHVLFLGVGRDVIGSTVVWLCRNGCYGDGTLAAQLVRCHAEAVAFARNRIVVPEFTPSALGLTDADQYPVMETTKGAHNKLLLEFVADAAEIFAVTQATEESMQVATMTRSLQDAVKLMDRCGEVMSETEASECCEGLETYQREYAALASQATDREELLWKLRPKFHVVAHIVLSMRETHLNPRYWSCWMDEDFMAKCRALCQKVRARGVTVSRNALQRYIWQWGELAFAANNPAHGGLMQPTAQGQERTL